MLERKLENLVVELKENQDVLEQIYDCMYDEVYRSIYSIVHN